IGEGHFDAWVRQGLKEVTHGLLPAFPQQHGQIIEEPGLFGNPTQGEVAKARDEDLALDHNQEPTQQWQMPQTAPQRAGNDQQQAMQWNQPAVGIHGPPANTSEQANTIQNGWMGHEQARREAQELERERGGPEM